VRNHITKWARARRQKALKCTDACTGGAVSIRSFAARRGQGFSLHTACAHAAEDRQALEQLCRLHHAPAWPTSALQTTAAGPIRSVFQTHPVVIELYWLQTASYSTRSPLHRY